MSEEEITEKVVEEKPEGFANQIAKQQEEIKASIKQPEPQKKSTSPTIKDQLLAQQKVNEKINADKKEQLLKQLMDSKKPVTRKKVK